MSSTSWEDLNRRWRELAEQQTEAARGWLDGQGGAKNDAAGLSELWRSWMAMGSLGTGMPTMPISDAEARDVAAYLYTLK